MASIENKVETLIKERVENLGYDLYDVEYAKEAKNFFLRIYIDSKKGISLEDCEKVSNEINEPLDKSNIITEQYFLEVSSPGIEKVLRKDKHLENNIGEEVEVKLFKKDDNGSKVYIGILKSFNDKEIQIETNEEIIIERKNIAQIKTIYNWEN
jgi:ribosome maturation factor RimP